MTTHSSILAWEMPWREEPGGLQSMVLQRVRHDLVTKQQHNLNTEHALQSPIFSWPSLWFSSPLYLPLSILVIPIFFKDIGLLLDSLSSFRSGFHVSSTGSFPRTLTNPWLLCEFTAPVTHPLIIPTPYCETSLRLLITSSVCSCISSPLCYQPDPISVFQHFHKYSVPSACSHSCFPCWL